MRTLLAAVFSFALGACEAHRPASRAPTEEALHISGTTLTGEAIDTRAEGAAWVVTFGASWCPACREELPQMDRLARAYASCGIRFLLVLNEESAAKAQAFVKEAGLSLPVVADHEEQIAAKFGVSSLPHTFVFGSSGTVEFQHAGKLDRQGVAQLLDALVAVDLADRGAPIDWSDTAMHCRAPLAEPTRAEVAQSAHPPGCPGHASSVRSE
ncbi:MAG: TlpA family protein disulfide reductase [Myxococcales bacterium]|nr:TlpA family protein disulfide reductase [Myxococcales bacterium]